MGMKTAIYVHISDSKSRLTSSVGAFVGAVKPDSKSRLTSPVGAFVGAGLGLSLGASVGLFVC